MFSRRHKVIGLGIVLWAMVLLPAACAPAAQPSPTAAPSKGASESVSTQAPAAKPTAAPAAVPAASPAAAKVDTKAVEDFYRGKTVRIIVGASAGGGYDTYSRAIARHLGKYIPGNPSVIVDNMPGAGFLLAANHVYNVAPKDGTVIGNISVGVAVQQLMGTPQVQFDATKFSYLGVPTTDNDLCVASKASGLKSLAETLGPNGKQFIAGGDSPGSPTDDEVNILRMALDANIKLVSGYAGTSKIRLAVDQGEVHGLCGWSWESLKTSSLDRVQSGDYVIISQNNEKAHKDLPNVPVAYDLAKTDEGRKLIHFGITLTGRVQREYVTPPGVPAERVEALRRAFEQTMLDKEFLADADKAKLNIDPVSGDEAQKLVHELMSMPEDVKAKLAKVWRP